jgi:hypothetical protein
MFLQRVEIPSSMRQNPIDPEDPVGSIHTLQTNLSREREALSRA